MAELFEAAGRVHQRHLEHLRALGVAPATIARLGSNRWPAFGVVNAEIDRGGCYQPCDGPAHIAVSVREAGIQMRETVGMIGEMREA